MNSFAPPPLASAIAWMLIIVIAIVAFHGYLNSEATLSIADRTALAVITAPGGERVQWGIAHAAISPASPARLRVQLLPGTKVAAFARGLCARLPTLAAIEILEAADRDMTADTGIQPASVLECALLRPAPVAKSS